MNWGGKEGGTGLPGSEGGYGGAQRAKSVSVRPRPFVLPFFGGE